MIIWKIVIVAVMMFEALLPVWADATGVIRGQVNFIGSPPANDPLKITGDAFCEQIHARTPIMQGVVTVNSNRTLRNVVVWISKGGPDSYYKNPASRHSAVLTQENCVVSPRVLAVQTGQQLEVRNADPTVHNINMQPKNNPRYNKAMVPGAQPALISFKHPEIAIKLKSDIHPWMVAWVAVFDHPGFGVTGEDGRFEIKDLPQGDYVLNTWHEKFGIATTPVVVQEQKPAEVLFNYTAEGSKNGTQITDIDLKTTTTDGL